MNFGESVTLDPPLFGALDCVIELLVPEGVRIVKVQDIAVIISKYKWEDRVLHEIVEASSRFLIQFSEVLEVSDGALLPTTGQGV